LLPTARVSEAACSLCSLPRLLMMRRSRTPSR
jgi:putative addiction module component (TIGR02574 family)